MLVSFQIHVEIFLGISLPRHKHPCMVRLYPERRVHPDGAVPALRGRRVLGVLCHPGRTRPSRAGSTGAGAVPEAGWLPLLPAQQASAAQRDSVPCLHGCLRQRLSLCSWGREEGVSLLAFLLLSACSQGSPCCSQVLSLPPNRQKWGVQGWWGGTNLGVGLAWLSFLAQHASGLGCGSPGNTKFNFSPLLFSGVRLCSVLQHPHLAPDPNHTGKGDSRVTPQCRTRRRHREFSSKTVVTSWPGPAHVIFTCF